ncbi:hypothetical protein BH18THE2_BH18THE2_17810 [soil metagenome]
MEIKGFGCKKCARTMDIAKCDYEAAIIVATIG